MGVIVTPKDKIDEYFASSRLSQSEFKGLLGGLESYKSKKAKNEKDEPVADKASRLIGSAVDVILTGAPGQFEEEFHVSELTKLPSDVEVLMIKHTFQGLLDDEKSVEEMGDLKDHDLHLQEAISFHDWYKGKPGEKRTNGLIEGGNDYFQDLKNAQGKKVLDQPTKLIVDGIVMSLRTHPRTAKYFNREEQAEFANIDFYYQKIIYFTYRGIECKAMLDLVVVIKDEDGRILIVQPIDLKTMAGDTIKFAWAVKQWRYDIQAAWYKTALYHWLTKMDAEALVNPEYEIRNFQFVVESTTIQGKPLVYTLEDDVLDMGRNGRDELKLVDTDFFEEGKEIPDAILVYQVKGYENLIDEYVWYEENGWETDREIVEAEGEPLKLGWNGINK